MVTERCPFCGGETDIPMLFPRVRQKIFRYIWENPGCSVKDILEAIGPRSAATMTTNLSAIRVYLMRSTKYRLVSTQKQFDRRNYYKIVNAKPSAIVEEGIPDGTV